MNRKLQGEIFGVALFFVIIIIGVIVYAQIKAIEPDVRGDIVTDAKYKILAESTMGSILDMSTGCYTERGRDSVKDMINFCLMNSFSDQDVLFTCNGVDLLMCNEAINIINNTLNLTFSSQGIGEIPYLVEIRIPRDSNSILHEVLFTNFGNLNYRGRPVTEDNYRNLGFKKAPSGLKTWPTSRGNIEVEVSLYYR